MDKREESFNKLMKFLATGKNDEGTLLFLTAWYYTVGSFAESKNEFREPIFEENGISVQSYSKRGFIDILGLTNSEKEKLRCLRKELITDYLETK